MKSNEPGAMFQLPLIQGVVAAVEPISLDEANSYIDRWAHELGPITRPFGSQSWALMVTGHPAAVAVSASTVSSRVVARLLPDEPIYQRSQVVELARLCSPNRWANRVMLRLWREVCAQRWPYWQVEAAISYSDGRHTGDLYRFDGWQLWNDDCGSGGGGTWSRPRAKGDAAHGRKKLWGWRYDLDVAEAIHGNVEVVR